MVNIVYLMTTQSEHNSKQPIPVAPVAPPGQQIPPEDLAAHAAWVKGQKEVAVLMLLTMDLDIQRNLAHLGAYDMLQELKAMFSKQAEQELLQTNFNMHGMGKTVNELHAMLKLHEESLPKKDANPALHAIRAGRVQKNQKNKPHKAGRGGKGKGKGKNKMGYAHNNVPFAPKPKTPPPPKKDNPAKDAICHQCGEVGHWRRNCPVYAELMKKKKLPQGASASGIFTIELYSFPSKSWIYDTGLLVLHNCILTQGLRGSRKLKPGALSLYVGDGHRAAVEAIGTYHLELPSGLVIVLNNFLKDNLVYFMAVPRDGIFEIDMSCSNTNDSSMKVCFLSGKMARKPYSHQVERAKDLLGLIHTDVCGPFRIVSRQGASYFVTFTDDFSRYGYVYLLKHKHEVFETFKVFQKEVENQLGKTIKSLRSDRGGEYMSQEFLDHLKEHGIIAHRTPPYTPQNNGVSERRNRTLLDMVRSMMSQTTLPKSFWDYALETAARILNMVPSKKVDKTPYEIWHGQAPKLSYLRVWGCEAFVKHDTLTKPDKLDPRSYKCIFVGYPKETMGYSFYNPSENKVFVARNAEFFESKLLDLKASGSVEDLELIQKKDNNPSAKWMSKPLFLNGHLSEEVYMEQPKGFVNPKYPNHVCKLKRSIYGLKQASRQWNKRFDDEIKKFGFAQNPDEPCVYLKASGSYVAILILYVDDILLMGNNIPMLQDVKSYLGRSFAMKNLRDATYILGIKIYPSKPWNDPKQEKLKLEIAVHKVLQRLAVGNSSMQNISPTPRYRIFIINPGEEHWTAVKNILKYLRNTKDMFLVYGDMECVRSNGGAIDWEK
ncbi:retrotransposon protein, putative, ty1-copia subclass [Tanacetum coccineum]